MINKTDMLADIERVLVPEADIHARIKEVGAQIAADYRGKCQKNNRPFRAVKSAEYSEKSYRKHRRKIKAKISLVFKRGIYAIRRAF